MTQKVKNCCLTWPFWDPLVPTTRSLAVWGFIENRVSICAKDSGLSSRIPEALRVTLGKWSLEARCLNKVVVFVLLLTVMKVSEPTTHDHDEDVITPPINNAEHEIVIYLNLDLIYVGLRITSSPMSYDDLHWRSTSDLRN